mmetsp:Transcript_26551/g.84211  ORF Transcript_26551/g.84211 Transcript_26551/m.84211 type:complete len:236 (+) Transcript_26551:111-818(+)
MAPGVPPVGAVAARMQHRPLRRIFVMVAAACAACRLWSCTGLSAFTVVGPAVRERPSADSRDDAEGASRRQARGHQGHGSSKVTFNATMLQEGGQTKDQRPEVAQGPPWATCFVEYVEAGRPALEEWLLRGEKENVAAFRAWRQHGSPHGPETASVRCVPEAKQPEEELLCVECLSHSGALPSGPAGPSASRKGDASVAMVQATLVTTFSGLKQCLAGTVGGMGFCKTGKVVVPA